MKFVVRSAAVLAVAALFSGVAAAQKSVQTGPGAGGSPHYKSEYTIDGAHLSISYGRPSLKGRPEAQVMPPGQVWRTGADTATTLITDKTLVFGGVTLPPGSYTINTVPGPTGWQLVLGKLSSPGQWGVPYKADLELGRSPMTIAKATSPVEQLTIMIQDTPAGGTLHVEWGLAKASIPFKVQ